MRRAISELGRLFDMNFFSASPKGISGYTSRINFSTPCVRVGPGKTELTVTFVPLVNSASERDILSCIAFVAL